MHNTEDTIRYNLQTSLQYTQRHLVLEVATSVHIPTRDDLSVAHRHCGVQEPGCWTWSLEVHNIWATDLSSVVASPWCFCTQQHSRARRQPDKGGAGSRTDKEQRKILPVFFESVLSRNFSSCRCDYFHVQNSNRHNCFAPWNISRWQTIKIQGHTNRSIAMKRQFKQSVHHYDVQSLQFTKHYFV